MVVNIHQSTRLLLRLSTRMMLPQSSLMGFAEGASTAAPPIPPLGEGRTLVQEKWFVFFFFYQFSSFINVKTLPFFFFQLCNKCGLFERTHSRPRPEQFPHKRGPLAVSVSRGRSPSGNHLPPISNNQPGYQYHHTQLTPLTASEYHQNPLPGLQTWQNNSGNSTSSNNLNNGTSSQPQNGSNNRGASPPEPQSVSSNGGGGGASTNMGPLLMPRRQLLDSPKMTASDSSNSRSGRPFDEPLSSNSAGGSAAVASNNVGGDSSRSQSQPATPPSRSSMDHPVAVKSRDGGPSAGHTPPPPSAIPSVGSSARDQA